MSQAVRIIDVQNRTESIDVAFDDGVTARFHPIWLRDACRCEQCRYPDTLRRINESIQIPIGLTAASVEIAADGTALEIGWPDGHASIQAASWLRPHAATEPAASGPVDRLDGKSAWGSEIADRLPWMDYSDVISDPEAMLCWLETIDQTGFALLRGVPTDRATMTELAHRVGPVRASNYGVDWEIEATEAPQNAVYSARRLSAHSDLPYRESPPGLQFLLSHIADAPGGESMLVDGYRVAEALLATDPTCWTTLTEVPVQFTWVDNGYDLQFEAPIIGLRPDGSYGIIRHAPGLLAPFDPHPESFERLYSAVHRLTRMLADPAFEIRVRLEPGDLLAFDNLRILHGRAAFDLSPGGRRHLLGCYLDLDDLRSSINVLRRNRK